MSQFIQYDYNPRNFLERKSHVYSAPRLQSLPKALSLLKHTEQQKRVRTKIVQDIFQRSRKEQIHKNAIEEEEELGGKLRKIRSNMRTSLLGQGLEKAMNNKRSVPNLGNIYKNQPKKIDLIEKNAGKIAIKMQSMSQAQEIQVSKQNLIIWRNSVHNNPLESPIFRTVTNLIERMNSISQGPSRKNSPRKINRRSYHRISRTTIFPLCDAL